MSDFGWAIVVLVFLGILIGIAKMLSSVLSAEWLRKIIHVGIGCVSLGFPFMFENRLTVLYLGLIIIPALLLLRLNKKLRKKLGFLLLDTNRKSYSEFYFLIAVVTVFLLHEAPYEYLISIAVLTFTDSIAALVGVSYGRFRVSRSEEEDKISEGSIMFFIVAYFSTLIPLQLFSEVDRAEVLVVSFLIGLLAALTEMVSVNGNENLLLPILTLAFLRYNISQPLTPIFINMGLLLLLIIPCIVIYKRTTITKLSIVYSLFTAYIILIHGGYTWLIPAIMLFIMSGIFPLMPKEERLNERTYRVVECNAIVGISCLITATFFPEHKDALYLAFSLAFACHMTINTYSRLVNFKRRSETFASIYSILKAIIFIFFPTFIFSTLGSLEFIIYLLFLLLSIHFAIYLTKKFDYGHITNEKLMGHKLSVGAIVLLFTIVLTQFII